MLLYYLKLLYDPAAFQAWRTSHPDVTPVGLFERIKSPLKALLMAVGAYIMSTPPANLPAFIPPKYGALIMAASAFIQKNPDLVRVWSSMTDSQKTKVQELAVTRAGAPDAVAPLPPKAV
jgi:hypothetical protein